MLQCVLRCVLQYVGICCSVMQCVFHSTCSIGDLSTVQMIVESSAKVCCSVCCSMRYSESKHVAVCVAACVAVWYSVLQMMVESGAKVCCSMYCSVCCSVLEYVAMCVAVLQVSVVCCNCAGW